MAWITAVINIIVALVKGIWGTDKPTRTTVSHPSPEMEVSDGKTDQERLNDLDL